MHAWIACRVAGPKTTAKAKETTGSVGLYYCGEKMALSMYVAWPGQRRALETEFYPHAVSACREL